MMDLMCPKCKSMMIRTTICLNATLSKYECMCPKCQFEIKHDMRKRPFEKITQNEVDHISNIIGNVELIEKMTEVIRFSLFVERARNASNITQKRADELLKMDLKKRIDVLKIVESRS